MNKPKPIDSELTPPSEQFEDAVRHSGSAVIDCELCGRTHFSTGDRGCYDEGELEKLLEKEKADPDRYRSNDYDSNTWGEIDGKQAVIGCPCNLLRKYENWFWAHRFLIARYLTSRAKDELAIAQAQNEQIAPLDALRNA